MIKVNCNKVYESGLFYSKKADEILNIQKRIDSISSDIFGILGGAAGNNFTVSFIKHIKALDAPINFLEDNSQLLKTTALQHGNADGIFVTQMERSELDERQFG